MNIVTLRRPSEFKRVRGGVRWASPLFVIEGRRRPDSEAPGSISGPRFGFTITRKVGNAVVRNRIRRRLKEALRTLGEAAIAADHDYVVVASRAAHDYPFAGLQGAFREAFERLQRQAEGGGGRARRSRGGAVADAKASEPGNAAGQNAATRAPEPPAGKPRLTSSGSDPSRQ